MSTLRPPAWAPACSQNSLNPSTMSMPGVASGPVSGARTPILIGPDCACAAEAAAQNAASAASIARLIRLPWGMIWLSSRPPLACPRDDGGICVARRCVADHTTARLVSARRLGRTVTIGGVNMASQPPAVPASAQGEEMDAAARERFGRGARTEDGPLITGAATFTDDIGIPGQCHAAFVRAPIAHGRILAVETARAAAMPGVIDVVTGKDLEADAVGPIPPLSTVTGRNGKPFVAAAMPVLASERVRYVGEPIAMVVAETAHEAQDAAEAVGIRFETLPAFPNLASAMAANEPAIWPEAPGNIVLDWEDGDAAAVDAG